MVLRLITEMKRSNSGPQLGTLKDGAKKKKAEQRWMFSQKVLFWPLCSYEAEGSIQ